MKRIISIILVLMLLIGCLPMTVFGAENTDVTRYSVIILDTSGSMDGTPEAKQKVAAIKFCEAVLEAEGDNYVAIVELNSTSSTRCNFTDNIDTLKNCINNMSAYGGTNINQALSVAGSLLQNVGASGENVIKNIVLCSDGLPQSGSRTSTGPYTYSDYSGYDYANYCYNTATSLKNDYYIYTLGFFHSLYGSNLTFANKFMNDLQNAGYYEVNDPEDLEFTFGDIAEDITKPSELKKITFTYQSGSDYNATCWYTDDYFSKGSYTFNQSLATMSLAFAMSAFGSGKDNLELSSNEDVNDLLLEVYGTLDKDTDAYPYYYKAQNAVKLLGECGFDNVALKESFFVKPNTDSIGAVVGSKAIGEDCTLIALAVRGGGYEQEWASNFTIGTTGQHQGFDAAKTEVLEFLSNYIDEKDITGNVKIWITGYSRAAATANLVAGDLDNDYLLSSDISYDYDDIYAYCFETPAGARTDQVKYSTRDFEDPETLSCYPIYNNIFNIINSSDPVPYVAPAAMGFGRYGYDKYLPSAEADPGYAIYDGNGNLIGGKLYEMLEVYKSLPSTDTYIVDDFQMKKLGIDADVNWDWFDTSVDWTFIFDDTKNDFSQGVFLSNYVTILSREFIGDRNNYVAVYQDEIREICSVVFGCTSAQSKIMMESIITQAKDNWGALAWSYVYNTGVKGLINKGDEDAALQIISDWLNTAVQEAGITNYDANMIERAGKDLGDLLLALVVNHPNYFTTAILNGGGLGAAHYPELCFAWMASMDDNYDKNNMQSFNNGGYRVIRINCEVDVDVYDENGATVASIVNDTPQKIAGSSIISTINEDGEKIVILPIDTTYGIRIIGREDDTVNYGIDEYCAQAGDFTRAVDYFGIDLKVGEALNGEVPAYNSEEIENDTPNGSTAKYTLVSPAGEQLSSDSDLTGDEALNAYFNVTAVSSNENYGVALGSGVHQYGNFALVEAFAAENCTFIGWYDNGKCVSTESAYRVCVTEDVELTARFRRNSSGGYTDNSERTLIFETNGGSAIAKVTAESGTTIDLSRYVPEKDGFVFAGWYADRELTKKITSVELERNMTVYAKWIEKNAANPFIDVAATDYFFDAVLWAVENNVTTGTTATTFSPTMSCTRAQAVTFLWRAAGSPVANNREMPFIDVPYNSYYYDAILWAVEQGIVTGVGDGKFAPDATCSRAQIVTMLWRLNGEVIVNETTMFSDVKKGAYYENAVKWAVSYGIAQGTGNGTFAPNAICTRAQIVTFLWRNVETNQ